MEVVGFHREITNQEDSELSDISQQFLNIMKESVLIENNIKPFPSSSYGSGQLFLVPFVGGLIKTDRKMARNRNS
jgi:hypothetical protein